MIIFWLDLWLLSCLFGWIAYEVFTSDMKADDAGPCVVVLAFVYGIASVVAYHWPRHLLYSGLGIAGGVFFGIIFNWLRNQAELKKKAQALVDKELDKVKARIDKELDDRMRKGT